MGRHATSVCISFTSNSDELFLNMILLWVFVVCMAQRTVASNNVDDVCQDLSSISCPAIPLAANGRDVTQLVPKRMKKHHLMANHPMLQGTQSLICEKPDCLSNPCLNGGTCTETLDGFRCLCCPDYSGIRCEMKTHESTTDLATTEGTIRTNKGETTNDPSPTPGKTDISTTDLPTTESTIRASQGETTNDPSPTLDLDVLFVADREQKKILVANVSDLKFKVFVDGLEQKPIYLTFSRGDQDLLWTEYDWDHPKANKGIWRYNLLNKTRHKLSNGYNGGGPFGIVVAESTRVIYCTYIDNNVITSITVDDGDSDTMETEFTEVSSRPRALAVDETRGHLYWSKINGIERASLSDASTKTLIFSSPDNQYNIFGLSIDPTGNRIYFSASTTIKVFYKNDLSNTANTTAIELTEHFTAGQRDFFDVSFFNGKTYWLERGGTLTIGTMTCTFGGTCHFTTVPVTVDSLVGTRGICGGRIKADSAR